MTRSPSQPSLSLCVTVIAMVTCKVTPVPASLGESSVSRSPFYPELHGPPWAAWYRAAGRFFFKLRPGPRPAGGRTGFATCSARLTPRPRRATDFTLLFIRYSLCRF